MGEVWSGRHRDLGFPVAVKVLTARIARDPHFQAVFRNEVLAAASLDHPCIVMVFEQGEVGVETEDASEGRLTAGSPYLAMELVEGGPLSHRRGLLQWPELRAVLLSLLDALAHAHARGVVHRDIKPGNVLVAPDGVKLGDFGLAQPLEGLAAGRMPRAVPGGTPGYMAPEQFERRTRDFGAWTDLYSLGCLAWALTTGLPPFGHTTSWEEAMAAHLHGAVPELRARIAIPDGYEAWLRRLLRKDAGLRFRRAADAAWALAQLGDAAIPPAEPPPATVCDEGALSSEPSRSTLSFVTDPRARSATSSHRIATSAVAVDARGRAAPPLPEEWQRPSDASVGRRFLGAGLSLYGLRVVPMVDRAKERDALWAALRRVRSDGRSRAVVLVGPAGCGKSRLAEWLGERAHEVGSGTVLKAMHGPVAGPTHGLGAMVGRYLRCVGLSRSRALLRIAASLRSLGVADEHEGHALTELVFPSSERDRAAGARAVHFGNPQERYAVVRRLLERVGRERPVVLWLEDVHWGLESLEFLAHLLDAQSRGAAPVLAVVTARLETLAERRPERELLDALCARDDVERIDVGPLATEHRRELIRAVLGLDGDVARRVEERTAGNPLFAVQLVGDWVQRGLLVPGRDGFRLRETARVDLPDDLHAVWASRIERLLQGRSPRDEVALELAALLGQDVSAPEWSDACRRAGFDPPWELVHALLAQRLATVAEGGESAGWSFVHPMLRESVERRAAEAGRATQHHALCAAALQERTGRGIRARIGRHRLAAGDREGAVAPLLAGVDEAIDGGDTREAQALISDWEGAVTPLHLPEADERWGDGMIWQGRLARAKGDRGEAEALFVQAAERSNRHGWTRIRSMALADLAHLLLLRGEHERAATHLDEAHRLAVTLADEALIGRCCVRLAYARLGVGDLEQAAVWGGQAYEANERAGNRRGAADCLVLLGHVESRAGRLTESVDLVERARVLYDELGARSSCADCLNLLGDLARFRGDLDLAERRYREAIDWYRTLDAIVGVSEVNLALVLVERARYADARRILEENLASEWLRRAPAFTGTIHVCVLPCAAAVGDWEAWDRHYARGEALLDESLFVHVDVARMAGLAGRIAAERGEPARAIDALNLAAANWDALNRREEAEETRRLISDIQRGRAEPEAGY